MGGLRTPPARRAPCIAAGVEPARCARRATLYGLPVSAAVAGLQGLLVWLAFGLGAAALVGGGAFVGSGLLALLSRHGPTPRTARRPPVRGALLQAYGAALLVVGGLLLRAGAPG